MNELKIFSSQEFGQVRTIEENGNILFCGNDVAKALGYVRPQNAIDTHCRYTLKRGIPHPQSNEKTLEMLFIPEGDLYRLIASSKLPSAEKFEKWVFDEVLPTIRKHGAYMTPEKIEEALLNPDTIIKLATDLKAEREKRLQAEKQIENNKPMVLFAESVQTSKTSILVGELAKLLNQNGADIGQNRLFEWLRNNGYLIKRKGTDYNMPTQYSMDLGLFEIKETSITHADGHISVNKTPKVTGKGQIYFVNKFKNIA